MQDGSSGRDPVPVLENPHVDSAVRSDGRLAWFSKTKHDLVVIMWRVCVLCCFNPSRAGVHLNLGACFMRASGGRSTVALH